MTPDAETFDFPATGSYGFLRVRFSQKSFALPQKPFRKFPARDTNQPPPSVFQKSRFGGTFKTHFSYRQREQGLPAAADYSKPTTTARIAYKGKISFF